MPDFPYPCSPHTHHGEDTHPPDQPSGAEVHRDGSDGRTQGVRFGLTGRGRAAGAGILLPDTRTHTNARRTVGRSLPTRLTGCLAAAARMAWIHYHMESGGVEGVHGRFFR